MVGEDSNSQQNVSKKMSLIIGARRHLEWGHEKHVIETIQSHPAQVSNRSYFLYIFSHKIFLEKYCAFTSRSHLQCSRR